MSGVKMNLMSEVKMKSIVTKCLFGLFVVLLLNACGDAISDQDYDSGSFTDTGPGPGSIGTPSALIASGPLVINGDQDVIISGLHISNPGGNCIDIRNGSSNIIIENSEIGPCGDKGIDILYSDNVSIRNNYLHDVEHEAIMSYESHHIAVDSNVMVNVESGYEGWTTRLGNLSFTNNFIKNVSRRAGSANGGNIVSLAFARGENIRITNNVGINILGESNTEDLINIYKSNGTADSPIQISSNKLKGGGPSASGGGIILGDTNGGYQLSEDNILVNPGQYGLAITGGHHNTHRNNRVYSDDQRSYTNVGLVVWRVDHPEHGGTPPGECYDNTVELNQVTWWQGPNYNGNGQPANRLASWNPASGSDGLQPNCGTVAGWSNNQFDTDSAQPANLNASLWNPAWNTPAFLPQNPYWN